MENSATTCYGCINDQPNQLAHINCPNGCLHDINSCPECTNESSDDEVFGYSSDNEVLNYSSDNEVSN